MPSSSGHDRLAADAEAVRAYLVSVRCGSPFLSGADAALLHDWLTAGLRIGVVVRAIDRVSTRRLAQRTRAPLSLASCRAEVRKLAANPGRWASSARAEGRAGRRLTTLHEATEGECADHGSLDTPASSVDGPESARLYAAALRQVEALTESDPETRCEQAVAIGRSFFDALWDQADRAALLAEVSAEMEDLRELCAPSEWDAVCEAAARDRLRRRYPRLTATAIYSGGARGVA